ncbi:MAG: enoyl-CoA hydratase-related protein [Furfurilactobacillus sp.]|jgi:enoyl-CoA hydratase|uniref:Enoyl-CoA hydratase-related protein n=1 Tax=Furfurilactobacillus milii TaxID=2888272 RepID=A0ABT6D6F4_9LACO|nr:MULTISPECIES: enoyl-CoA hydratase-related protein [Furfurilactobacillus]QLE66294.1 Naphthoate synthase [Furfurilactobacillus rossiae]MCF6159750.1 enoyl-CoA hydratase/isomerase family protein [Furfurilactobacillus milii]MCF6163165.1 enoyl-CoA hydratase/isomerase family protein [Furfurilactobacillus milii]MCF6419131.1 enoyl-CoA hydratase/isomerase family protein [Furfurilactobacillus milii]MCH4010994.1 enoyl-CoA hydratase-related protein [Furfurilactobacillus sp.]
MIKAKTYENVLLHVDNEIATLTINRPKSMNVLNTATLTEIGQALDEVRDNADLIKVLVITGAGEKAFVAGADIFEMRDMNSLQAATLSKLAHESFGKIENLPQLTIAAVNGYCLGGGLELASSCDIRVGSSKAKFGQPEVTLGIVPGFGGTQRLTRLVGRGKAKEMIATGTMVDAQEAYRVGIIEEIAEPDELMDKVHALANTVIKNGLIAVGMAKYVIDRAADLPLDTAIDFETQMWAQTFATEDQTEGMTAFLEKRKPAFPQK